MSSFYCTSNELYVQQRYFHSNSGHLKVLIQIDQLYSTDSAQCMCGLVLPTAIRCHESRLNVSHLCYLNCHSDIPHVYFVYHLDVCIIAQKHVHNAQPFPYQ